MALKSVKKIHEEWVFKVRHDDAKNVRLTGNKQTRLQIRRIVQFLKNSEHAFSRGVRDMACFVNNPRHRGNRYVGPFGYVFKPHPQKLL
jgi:hypothetical protein